MIQLRYASDPDVDSMKIREQLARRGRDP